MMTLEHKAFLLGKDNEPDGRQDALAFRDTLGMCLPWPMVSPIPFAPT